MGTENNTTDLKIINYLNRLNKCVRVSIIAKNLKLSKSYISQKLTGLRKRKEVGLYLNKYWGIFQKWK